MPPKKRTRADVESELAALQAELDSVEPDEEIWVKDPDSGHEVRFTGNRAKTIYERFGALFPAPDGADGDEGQDDEEEADPQPGGGGGYFRGRGKG